MERPQRKLKATAPSRSGETVTIACKHPSGIILRAFEMDDFAEPVMGGGFRTVKRARQIGEPFVIKGAAVAFGVIPTYQIIGGYALTEGVPADLWDRWLEQNRDSELVKNKLIYAHERHNFAVGAAKEQAKILSGMEPINPIKDPRNIQTRRNNLTAIEQGTRA